MTPSFPVNRKLNNINKGGVKVINASKDVLLADKAKIADTFLERLTGLLNRKSLDKGEALILFPSNCIHSFFMRFNIDVLFLDKNNKIVAALSSFKPFRLSPVYFSASLVIELPEFTIQYTASRVGDIIKIASS